MAHAANEHTAHDIRKELRSLSLTPEEIGVIRAFCAGRIAALNFADKKPQSIRTEIRDQLPKYRAIIQKIDAL